MVKGVGPKNAEALTSVGLVTIADLIDYWPRRYDDYTSLASIASIRPGLVTVKGTFSGVKGRYSKRGLHVTEGLLSDASGSVRITWFNQPYRSASLKNDKEYFVSGEFVFKAGKLGITNPKIELASDLETSSKIVPIYRETGKITSSYLNKIVAGILPVFAEVPETLPKWLVDREKLVTRGEALRSLHIPKTSVELDDARGRLGFEEIFQMQLAGQYMKLDLAREKSVQIPFEEKVAVDFVAHLPFALTPDQKRSVWQIYKDIERDTPMNRLVEGDVGSGKTAVAAMASIMTAHAGYQVLFMAPTEILARQHTENLRKLLAHTPYADTIELLVGGLSAKQKKDVHEKIANGTCRIAVGTNALVQDKVATENVGLVVIDEQHRFGVEQRMKLRSKAGLFPHVLCMTATPIPRTLALTLYGELDITKLASMPGGRSPITTEVILPTARAGLYKTIDKVLSDGRQAFIVCPVIEHNEETGLVAVEKLYETLSKGFFKHRKVGLLHGGMKPAEKDAQMQSFKKGDIDLLISTTVIEVGVDVPNATVMVVENADRFGLAQIHQLRGRVGRGEHPGFCYLIPTDGMGISKRLRVLEHVSDGFRLSEIDLELRGPGAIYGTRQSGALDLRIAELNDEALIVRAKKAAEDFVQKGEDLLQYPLIAAKVQHFRSISKLN
jgi:ATP-dependent DNA helicase RecG